MIHIKASKYGCIPFFSFNCYKIVFVSLQGWGITNLFLSPFRVEVYQKEFLLKFNYGYTHKYHIFS